MAKHESVLALFAKAGIRALRAVLGAAHGIRDARLIDGVEAIVAVRAVGGLVRLCEDIRTRRVAREKGFTAVVMPKTNVEIIMLSRLPVCESRWTCHCAAHTYLAITAVGTA